MVIPSNKRYLVHKDFPEYNGKSITFGVTNDCNLRCTYCYIHEKTKDMDMTFDIAKKIIDTMYANQHQYFDDPLSKSNMELGKTDSTRKLYHRLIFDFIGGEPLIRTGLVDQICDYIKYKNIKDGLNYSFLFNMTTNGITYLDKETRKYIKKNQPLLSVGMTIDGTQEMHDSCRIFENGNKSYDIVRKSIAQRNEDLPGSGTKVTIAPENLPYLAEAIIHLWTEVELQEVPANVVFEDKWSDEDSIIFERELIKLKNFLLKDKNYTRYFTTLFDEQIGRPIPASQIAPPCGGNGAMLHWMHDGSFYNCIRYAPNSCKDGKGFKLGDFEQGWNDEAYKYLCGMDRRTSSDDECFNCEVATGCAYCPGAQYDYFGDPNIRAKYICNMHKARVKVSKIFFEELHEQAEDIDFGDDVIFVNESARTLEYMADLNNKLTQIKLFMNIIEKYPDVNYTNLLEEYYDIFEELNDYMLSMSSEYLEGLNPAEYVLDWNRNYFIKRDLMYAKANEKAPVLSAILK